MKTALVTYSIEALLETEKTLDGKLDLLTSISICTSNDEVHRIAEGIRVGLCFSANQEQEQRQGHSLASRSEREALCDVLHEVFSDESAHLFI